jgi:phage shock protein A
MSHSITAEQETNEALNMQAAMWANRILTRKISNEQCKAEVRQKVTDAIDMEGRIRKYLNSGLVTDATFKTKAQQQIERIKAQAKAPPAVTQSSTGSKDGLWSTAIGGRK